MSVLIQITFHNQKERYNFFYELLGENWNTQFLEPYEFDEGISIKLEPYTIYETLEVPVDLQFFVHLAIGYGITKFAEFLYSKIKNCKINSVKVEEKEIGKSLENIEKALKDLEEKLRKEMKWGDT